MTAQILVLLLNALLVLTLVRRTAAADSETVRPSTLARLGLIFFVDACAVLWLVPRAWGVAYFFALVCLSVIALPSGQTAGLSRKLGGVKFPLYLLSIFTVSTLAYVHLPITTFLTSPGEIGIHLDYLLSTNLRDAMVLVYVAAALYAFAVSPADALRAGGRRGDRALPRVALLVCAAARVPGDERTPVRADPDSQDRSGGVAWRSICWRCWSRFSAPSGSCCRVAPGGW